VCSMADGEPQASVASGEQSALNDADMKYAQSLGGVAAPVLAGFSFATVVMVSAGASDYRWADVAIPALAIAAVAILTAIQCSKYIDAAYPGYVNWYGGLLVSYHLGLIAMLLGLGFALGPVHVQGLPTGPRWVACSIAWAVSAGQFAAFCFGRRSWYTAFRMLFTGNK
jgi:hypothetical protein